MDTSEKISPVDPPPYTQQLVSQPPPGYTAQPGYPAQPGKTAQPGYPSQSGNPPPQQSAYVLQPAQQFQQGTTVISLGVPASQTITLPPNPRPPNYLCVSICTCLFCFWPLGLAAIMFSCMVDSSYDAGDYAGALRTANIAKLLNSISYLLGFLGIITFIYTL